MIELLKETISQLRQRAARRMNELGIYGYKEDILMPYNAKGLRDLDEAQLQHLIAALEAMPASRVPDTPKPLRKQRSSILLLLKELGIEGSGRNWNAVNHFLEKPQIAGKLLYEMTEEELSACAKKLRAIIKKRQTAIAEETRLAQSN